MITLIAITFGIIVLGVLVVEDFIHGDHDNFNKIKQEIKDTFK